MIIYFITSNPHKVEEVRELAADKGISIRHLHYEYPELQLDAIEEVAIASANHIRREKWAEINAPFFIEDSGLLIHALNDFPGPFSAFVFRKIGNEGILKLMAGKEGGERRATFKTVVAFCRDPDAEPRLFIGTVEGRIADRARGDGGFGFDPIFEYEGTGTTFAEMSTEEKNKVSHRSRAFTKFLNHILQHLH